MKDLEIEKEKLATTLEIIRGIYEEEQQALNNLYHNFIGSRDELWEVAGRKQVHINTLKSALEKPYFARIDFEFAQSKERKSIYIGKNGIIKGTEVLVTDWRAPISSLYYDADLGECSFEAPDGLIAGIMTLKRQLEIERGELLNYIDVELVTSDELLQKYLNANNDARLKSIVSTIQKEQNFVIRKRLVDNLIIQGVAGSGKTTVALHRVAYLVYNYRQLINQNQFLIIGPNPIFLKYIRSVLPELDVTGVSQFTFEDFAKDYLNLDLKINSASKKVTASIAGKLTNDIDKFKCSLKYRAMLDEFLNLFWQSLTQEDLKMRDFVILDKNLISHVFNNMGENLSLNNRLLLTIDKLTRIIEDQSNEILNRYTNYTYQEFAEASKEEKEKLRKLYIKEREEIKKGCRTLLKKYFSKAKVDITKIYKLFITTITNYNIYDYRYLPELKKETLQNLKKGSYDFEDLSALLYLKYRMDPNMGYSRIRHVVIDEAQDLGEFNFQVLKNILDSATFSIFGDLAQSIYDYRGISSWDTVNALMFNNEGEIINFAKSYRTTAEIMEVADEVAMSIGLNKSDLVVRHGNPVTFTEVPMDNKALYIRNKILEFQAKGYKTIAIIAKTDLLASYLNDDLKEIGFNIPNVSLNADVLNSDYDICTISNQLAKGLEFDAVIIADVADNIYNSANALDMKLLYVAITRALHEVDILYTGSLTKVLDDYQKDKSVNARKLR